MAKEMMKDANNAISKEVATMKAKADISPIREDLATLQQDAREAARVLSDDARVLAKDVKIEGQKYYAKGKEELYEGLETAKERGRDQYAEIMSFVKSNPGQSLAVAFVGGMLASMIFGRRS
jgi:ElaB/YqjD/DUF883 family membrane-anchored ribosome-binding protein